MERDTIRIYSANKAGFLNLYVKAIGAGRDVGNDKAYIEFPMSAEVQELLKDYYDSTNLISKFIRSYNDVRKIMKETVM